MSNTQSAKPWSRGCVVGLSLGKFTWVGAGVAMIITGVALGAPQGANVVAGSAQIKQQGNLTKIIAADKTIINYSSFDIGRNETVRFIQPSATSKVLNRITSSDPTKIAGTIQANGIVYIVNPAGVFFANGSLVNVGGIYAAAGNISNNDFVRGVNNFTNVTGNVTNQGRMTIADGGVAALVGDKVANGGVISADRGVIAMVSGNDVVLGERGGVMTVRVNRDADTAPKTGESGIINTGTVKAERGSVRMVAGDMYALAIKNTGTVKATDIKVEAQGKGNVSVSGKLDARNGVQGGYGGVIQVTGNKVAIVDANIDASGRNGGGKVNIGGEFQGKGDMKRSEVTIVDNSSIRADAIKRGNGGEVVVWSDQHTSFNGYASAKGGELSGNGGTIETSGKQTLDIRGGRVNASAENGKAGTWMMDPFDVTIDQVGSTTGGTFDGSDPDTFTPSATAVVDVDDVNLALNNGTNVEIITGGAGADAGNITLVGGAVIDKTSGAATSLTLRAANDINIDGTIQSSSGALDINLLANNGAGGNVDPNPNAGVVNMGASGVINTAGGNLVIEGVDVVFAGGAAINTGAGDVTLRSTNSASTIGVGAGATGDFNVSDTELAAIDSTGTVKIGTVNGTGAVDINALALSGETYSLDVEGGSINTESIALGNGTDLTLSANTGNIDESGTPTLAADGGTITLRANDITFDGNVTINAGAAGTVVFAPNAGRSVGVNPINGFDFTIGQDEINNITADTLVIGSSNSGSLGVVSISAPGTVNNLTLLSGANIFSDSGPPAFISASNTVTLDAVGNIGSAVDFLNINNSTPNVVLNSGSDAFAAIISVAGTAVTLGVDGNAEIESTNTIDLTGAVGGNLRATSIGGSIAASSLDIQGNGEFETTAANEAISLLSTEVGGTVAFLTSGAAGSVTMTSSGAIDVEASSIGGDLSLTSDTSITDSGAMVVGGNADFETRAASGGDIILDESHTFAGTVMARSRDAADSATGNGEIDIRDTDAAMNFAGGETTGDVTLRANNLDITGTLTGGDVNLLPLNNGATIAINSAAGSFSLSSADLANIDSAGVVTVGNANSGAIAIGSSGAIDLSAETYSLTLRGGSATFSNGITLGNDTTLDIRSSGSITGSGVGTDVTIGGADGSLVTVADGNIDLETSVARLAAEAGGTLTVDEASNLIVDSLNGITGASSVGNLAITTQGQLSVANAIATTGAGTISLNAEDGDNGNLVVNDTITSQGGNITLNAENDVTLNGDAVITVAAGVGNVQITADSDTTNSGGDGTGGKITLADGAAISTAGNVSLTADGDIDDLGDSISSTAVIAGAEVSLISANGAIGATTSINTATTELIASGETGVAVTNTGNVDANLKSATGAVVFRNTGTLDTSGTWQGDSIDIVSSGAIIVDEDITANAGDASITSSTGSITVQTGDEIAASGGDITLAATDLILNGMLDAGTDEIFIDRSVAGTIGVGDATGDMTIFGAELARMTAAELTIGGTNTTGITVDNVSATNVANLPIVNLDATRDDASITFNGNASTFRGLNAQADDGLSVNVNLTATDGDLILNGDADNAADTDDSLALASGVTISTEPMGGDVFLAATTGGIEAAGSLVVNANEDIILGSSISSPSSLALNANGEIILQTAQSGQTLTINADDGLTLNANVNNTASAAILNADADADGNGTLVLASGQTINTGNNDLTITAADLTLDGSITSGTGVVSIRRATNGTIGLGSATGDMTISGDELQRITAATLRLGNSMTTAVNVADVSATNTANISSLIELFTDNINITGAFNTADADLSITRGNTGTIGVGSSAGDLYIDGAELAFITTNELLLGGGQTTSINVGSVSAAQSMGIELLRLESGDRIVFGGTDSTFRALSALARNGIAVNTNLTTTESNLILDANTDNDADSMDNLAISADRTLTSGGLLTLDATSGGIDAAGGVTLNAKGDININNNLAANGQITINADSDATGQGIIDIPTGITVTSSGNPITLVGSNLTLNGNILAGAGSVAIRRSNIGTITLGTGTRGMSISGAELARITSTGLSIGGATTRTLEVNGITAANSNNIVGITRLEAGADNGSVVFNGSASVFNALEVFADNSINVNAAVSTDTGGITMDADLDNANDGVDAVRLGANVTAPTTQDVVFNSAVQLRKDVTVAGNDITFNGTIDSETGRRGLSVNSNNTGITSFNGAVGGNKALLGIVTNADGTTRLGANIDTDGGSSLFNDIIRLTNDVRIRAKSGGGIFFNNLVDSQGATNRNLTVLVDTDTAANANSVPVISFANNVGSTFALGNLFLNYDPSSNVDGHTNVPRVATIVARPRNSSGAIVNNPASSITFNTSGTFRMGKNEKLTAGGILNINAGTAVLGDLTSLGNMNVTASNIQLIRRNASQIIGTTNTSIAFDQGTDYVSGGNIAFSTVPTAIGTGAEPSFSTSSGTGDVNNTLGGFLFRAFGPINAADINNGTSSTVTLDLKADGPTNTNFADAIAGAIPRETRQNDVGQETSIGQAQMEDLKNLGIVPRNPTTQELLDFLIGRAVYNDMPRRTLPRADDYTTVVNRLPGERVTALLQSYDRVFNTDLTDEAGNTVLDEKTGVAKRVSRADEIKSTLLDSVRRFRSENETLTGEPDPVQFRTFVDNSTEDAKSAEFLDQLAGFLDQLESLGLTPRELQTSKNIMLKDVRPAGIGSVANFEAVIRSRPKVGADTLSMR